MTKRNYPEIYGVINGSRVLVLTKAWRNSTIEMVDVICKRGNWHRCLLNTKTGKLLTKIEHRVDFIFGQMELGFLLPNEIEIILREPLTPRRFVRKGGILTEVPQFEFNEEYPVKGIMHGKPTDNREGTEFKTMWEAGGL